MTWSRSTSISASCSATSIPSVGTLITEVDEELLPPEKLGGGEPDTGVAATEGALLYTRRFVREGAEWRTVGGMSREGDGMVIGVPACEGVRDLELDGVCD